MEQQDIIHFPFTVKSGSNDIPVCEVQYKGETKQFTPQEIGAFVLEKITTDIIVLPENYRCVYITTVLLLQ